MNGGLNLFATRAGLQSKSNVGSGSCVEHIPAFRLAAGQPDSLCAFIVRMHLHGKLFLREDDLHQQRKARLRRHSAVQTFSKVLRQLAKSTSLKSSVSDATAFPGEPDFSNGLIPNLV